MTTDIQNDIINILTENYYSLGVESGHEALANILTEFWNNQFEENLSDWKIGEWDFMVIVWELAKRWNDEGRMWTSHEEFYQKQYVALPKRKLPKY